MTRFTLALLLASTAMAEADQIAVTSRVTAVTLYPQGAEVTREIVFTAPPGAHDLLIADLPRATDPALLRMTSPDTGLGAFALRTDRLPPSDLPKTPAREKAEAAVATARKDLTTATTALDRLQARIEAQEARIALLSGLRPETGAHSAQALSEMAQMVATQVLEARETAIQTRAALPEATAAVTRAQEAQTQAEAARDALAQGAAERAALSLAITAAGGEGHVTLRHFISDAGWRPVYDLHLDRKAGQARLERGLLVTQHGGEDWEGVALTLSTAQPGQQAEASTLWPDLRRLAEPLPEPLPAASARMEALDEPLAAAPVAMDVAAGASFRGDTVVYAYPDPVSLADGVEDLRLALDSLTLPADPLARAVPRLDATAFLEAEITNGADEPLLPGTLYLYRDGMLTGMDEMPTLPKGGTASFGFGAIPGLVLTRQMPERMTGARGVFTASTQMQEKAVLAIENLTEESWPVRLIDQVPYSEQEELTITFAAKPAPTEADPEGQRGLLAWDFELAPGTSREIALETTLSWPEGKALQ